MQTNLVFYAVFLIQLLLISLYLPQKMRSRIRHMFVTYPPGMFPHLYPEPVEKYESALRRFRNINLFTFAVGVVAVVLILSESGRLGREGLLTNLAFVVQVVPMIFLEIATHKYYKLMRENNVRTRRTAILKPRRFFDFVSPGFFALWALVYVSFCLLIIYINQFDYPWFGGYANIVGVTVINILFGLIIARKMYGTKSDPHQTDEDRNRQIKFTIKQLLAVSIAYTVYIAIIVVLGAQELRHLQPLLTSLYYQLIAVAAFRTLPILDSVDFEVYKDNHVAN